MNTGTCRRVVLVVLDGLRPDAIDAYDLAHLATLQDAGAWTHLARTVQPSVTAAAMGSLLTGVHPSEHGLTSDRFRLPRPVAGVVPLPELLRRAGLLTSGFVAQPPFMYRGLARVLAQRLGIDRPSFRGQCASEIVDAAVDTLESQRAGLVVLHLPDADRAGHAHGWMSRPYRDAAIQLDVALGRVADIALDRARNDTMVIACADHGGGGTVYNDHESPHPLDCTIPIIMAGAGVRRGRALRAASILDIPATILAALRVAPPACFAGRPMLEAFALEAEAA